MGEKGGGDDTVSFIPPCGMPFSLKKGLVGSMEAISFMGKSSTSCSLRHYTKREGICVGNHMVWVWHPTIIRGLLPPGSIESVVTPTICWCCDGLVVIVLVCIHQSHKQRG